MKLLLTSMTSLFLFSSAGFIAMPLHAQTAAEEISAKPKAPAATATAAKPKETEKSMWELYASDSTLFNVRFPKDYQYKSYELSINDSSSVYSEEIIATIASELDPQNPKNYLVQVEQSFGSPLKTLQIKKFLADEASRYEDFAKQNNGLLVTNMDVQHFGFLGKDLYLTYTDKLIDEKNKRALRIRILYTDSARVEMVLSGNASGMYSYYNDNFFESIRLTDGYGRNTKSKQKNWPHFSDANNIFTMVIPPKHPDYRAETPRYKLSKRVSSAHTIFYDPVLKQKMFYNVYAYKIGAQVTQRIARKILFAQHISKVVTGAPEDSLKLSFTEKDGYTIAATQLVIEPKKDIPYVDAIMLKAFYKDDIIVVQEMSGSQGHAFGDLSNTILDGLLFHPEKRKETTIPEILKKNEAYLAAKKAEQDKLKSGVKTEKPAAVPAPEIVPVPSKK